SIYRRLKNVQHLKTIHCHVRTEKDRERNKLDVVSPLLADNGTRQSIQQRIAPQVEKHVFIGPPLAATLNQPEVESIDTPQQFEQVARVRLVPAVDSIHPTAHDSNATSAARESGTVTLPI